MGDAVCETFTALYDAVGGIGSSAMTVAERFNETSTLTGLTACAAEEWRA
jgi:hypothetical protein